MVGASEGPAAPVGHVATPGVPARNQRILGDARLGRPGIERRAPRFERWRVRGSGVERSDVRAGVGAYGRLLTGRRRRHLAHVPGASHLDREQHEEQVSSERSYDHGKPPSAPSDGGCTRRIQRHHRRMPRMPGALPRCEYMNDGAKCGAGTDQRCTGCERRFCKRHLQKGVMLATEPRTAKMLVDLCARCFKNASATTVQLEPSTRRSSSRAS
jgi:hypothetical protein